MRKFYPELSASPKGISLGHSLDDSGVLPVFPERASQFLGETPQSWKL